MEIADAERRDIDIERRTKRIAHAVQELADGPEWEAISELEAKRNTAEKKDTYIKLTPVKICLSNLRSRSDSILNAPRKNFLGTTIGLQKGIGDAYKTSSFLAQDCMDCSSNAESEECAWEAHKAITASILRVQHGINILFNIVRPATRDKIMVHVRWMIRRDMPEVLGIEESSWGLPWSEEDFIRCLRRRNCIGMVAEYDERVVGFMLYELHKNRLHILNLVSSPYFRRRGVGTSMVNKLADKLSEQRRNRMLLELRETNLDAQLFFRDAGFRAISVLRDFYDGTDEDAYLMQYRYQREPCKSMVV